MIELLVNRRHKTPLIALISDCDADLLEMRWRPIGKKTSRSFYVRTGGLCGKERVPDRQLHRVVIERVVGRPLLPTEYVDHIDGNTLNNQRENLRLVTPLESAQHKPNYKHKYGRGVYTSNGNANRFYARVVYNHTEYCCGGFASASEAAAAARNKRIELGLEKAKIGASHAP